MKTNILIPMAGRGSRFCKKGYTEPKPLIDVIGSPMIEAVIKNLYNKNVNFIFILNKNQDKLNQITNIITKCVNDPKIIYTDKITDGPACTALLAKKYISEDSLIIANCDQIIVDYNYETLIKFCKKNKTDGIIGSFISTSNKNSYVKLSPNGEVTEVKEKIVISNIATNGLHFWKNGHDFINSAEEMIKNNERYKNEFYIAPSYNYMIKDGKRVLPFFYNLHYPIGTPKDLKKYRGLYEDIQT
jgi:dTDP-glucose pyrophosphorylase